MGLSLNPEQGRPLVSVLVPAYNHAPYVLECLDAISGQRFDGQMEILIGEDHSRDETRALVNDFVSRHPQEARVISGPHNVGMRRNFRRLAQAAQGEYIAYCEGDDYWHAPEKLQLQVDFLESHGEFSGVASDVDHLVRRGTEWTTLANYWRSSLGPMANTVTYTDLLSRNTVQTCTVVLRAEVVKSFLTSPMASTTYAVEDWPLFLHAALHAPLAILPQSLATYRRVPGSATNDRPAVNAARLTDQFQLIDDAARLAPGTARARAAGLAFTLHALIDNAMVNGDRHLVQRALAEGHKWGARPTIRDRVRAMSLALPLGELAARKFNAVRAARLEERMYRHPAVGATEQRD